MKANLKVTELSHDDLVNLFSTALYGNDAYSAEYSLKDYSELVKDCADFESKLATILLNGGEVCITDLYAEDKDEIYDGNNVKTTIETFVATHPWCDEEEYEQPTYHVTLQDIYNGLNKEIARPYVQELFVDEDGDMNTADCLLQIICFGDIIYG